MNSIDKAIKAARQQRGEAEQDRRYIDTRLDEWKKKRAELDLIYPSACRQIVESFDKVVNQFNSKFEGDKITVKSTSFNPSKRSAVEHEYIVPVKPFPSSIRCSFFPYYDDKGWGVGRGINWETSNSTLMMNMRVIGGCYLGAIKRAVKGRETEKPRFINLVQFLKEVVSASSAPTYDVKHHIYFVLFDSENEFTKPYWKCYLAPQTASFTYLPDMYRKEISRAFASLVCYLKEGREGQLNYFSFESFGHIKIDKPEEIFTEMIETCFSNPYLLSL